MVGIPHGEFGPQDLCFPCSLLSSPLFLSWLVYSLWSSSGPCPMLVHTRCLLMKSGPKKGLNTSLKNQSCYRTDSKTSARWWAVSLSEPTVVRITKFIQSTLVCGYWNKHQKRTAFYVKECNRHICLRQPPASFQLHSTHRNMGA